MLDLRAVATRLITATDKPRTRNFLINVARDDVQRLAYLPPIPGAVDLGGVIDLNHITHTHAPHIDPAQQRVNVLTG